MPLRRGTSDTIVSANIREMHQGKTYAHTKEKFGKKRADAQAVAVAMHMRHESILSGRKHK